MKKLIFPLILIVLFGCAKVIEVGKDKETPVKNPPQSQKTQPANLNKAEVNRLENVIEIHQEFQLADEEECLSDIHTLEVKDVSFVRISAFSLDRESSYMLHFRIYDKGQWGAWMILPENKEKVNPNRKVFSGLNVFQEIEKIQFRSSNATRSPVVFRLFVAHNKN